MDSPRMASRFSAFTLIEMLTAMAVFLLLAVIIFQVVSETARSTGSGNSRIEASRGARTSLDTLAEDLATVVRDYGPTIMSSQDANGNTTLAFLCTSRSEKSASGSPRLGGVFYKIMPRAEVSLKATVPMLCRGFLSVSWDDNLSGALSSVYGAAEGGASGSVFVDPLSDMVFRMEAVFMGADGEINFEPPTSASTNKIDLTELKAIIVGVAALDKKTQSLLLASDSQGMSRLMAALPKVTVAGQTPLDVWNTVNLDAFPPPVRQNIRFFQRTIYVK